MPSRLSYVWLSLKRGLGSRTAAEVLDAFGSPEAVFAADRQALTAAPCELRKTHVDLLCDKDTSEAEQVIRSCTEKNIQIITIGDSAYPDRCGRSRIRRPCCMCADAGRISTVFLP